jgi:hypothetical protein
MQKPTESKGLTDLPVGVRDEHVELVLREPAVLLAQLHVRHDGGHLTVELLPALLHYREYIHSSLAGLSRIRFFPSRIQV